MGKQRTKGPTDKNRGYQKEISIAQVKKIRTYVAGNDALSTNRKHPQKHAEPYMGKQ